MQIVYLMKTLKCYLEIALKYVGRKRVLVTFTNAALKKRITMNTINHCTGVPFSKHKNK
jgi:hypothetical protein